MFFVALVVNLKSVAVNRSLGEAIATEANTASWLPHEMVAALETDLRAPLLHSLERGLLTLAIIERGRSALSLRVTALAEEGLSSMSPLLQALALRPVLWFQQRRWIIEATVLAHTRWAGTGAWADFLSEPAGRVLKFHFGTPLVVPSIAEACERHASHFPHPLPIFAELARRWQDLGGPPLPTDVLSLCERGDCVAADYHLRASPIALSRGACPGFLGWVVYECRTGSSSGAAALTALARFAFFAGVGHYTSYGMGATRVTIGS